MFVCGQGWDIPIGSGVPARGLWGLVIQQAGITQTNERKLEELNGDIHNFTMESLILAQDER